MRGYPILNYSEGRVWFARNPGKTEWSIPLNASQIC